MVWEIHKTKVPTMYTTIKTEYIANDKERIYNKLKYIDEITCNEDTEYLTTNGSYIQRSIKQICETRNAECMNNGNAPKEIPTMHETNKSMIDGRYIINWRQIQNVS